MQQNEPDNEVVWTGTYCGDKYRIVKFKEVLGLPDGFSVEKDLAGIWAVEIDWAMATSVALQAFDEVRPKTALPTP